MNLMMESSKKIFTVCQNKLIQQVFTRPKVQTKEAPKHKKKISVMLLA